jgi:hypothetical protein
LIVTRIRSGQVEVELRLVYLFGIFLGIEIVGGGAPRNSNQAILVLLKMPVETGLKYLSNLNKFLIVMLPIGCKIYAGKKWGCALMRSKKEWTKNESN